MYIAVFIIGCIITYVVSGYIMYHHTGYGYCVFCHNKPAAKESD